MCDNGLLPVGVADVIAAPCYVVQFRHTGKLLHAASLLSIAKISLSSLYTHAIESAIHPFAKFASGQI
jgi:hypothetical protein